MSEEIKEILDYLKKEVDKFEESKTYLMETYNYREQDIENIEQHKKYVYFKKLLDYITNLQQKVEYLEKENKTLNNIINELDEELDRGYRDLFDMELVPGRELILNIKNYLKQLKEEK